MEIPIKMGFLKASREIVIQNVVIRLAISGENFMENHGDTKWKTRRPAGLAQGLIDLIAPMADFKAQGSSGSSAKTQTSLGLHKENVLIC